MSSKLKTQLSQQQIEKAEKCIELLKEHLHLLHKTYPDKDSLPPIEVQQDLFAELRAIL